VGKSRALYSVRRILIVAYDVEIGSQPSRLGRRVAAILTPDGPADRHDFVRGASGLGQKARSEAADAFAANVRPIIKEIQASGVSSLRGVARALTARGLRTARGGDLDVPRLLVHGRLKPYTLKAR
jgi:hypothetical protein